MSLSTLTSVISSLPDQTRCEILGKVSSSASILYGGASTSQIAFMAASIDEVSNGSGLQIITLSMWPDDELPEELKPMTNEILSNLAAINA